MRIAALAALLLLVPVEALPHRLDEYLEETLISVERDRLRAELTLTAGVAVFPVVAADIDRDGDGAISLAEQSAYAGRVLRDLSLSLDGQPLEPRLLSARFPSMDEMREGMGPIRLTFDAALPPGRSDRSLRFENRHQPALGVYLVNCLVSRDPDIRIVAQHRNYTQSSYRLDYLEAGMPWPKRLIASWSGGPAWLAVLALLLGARFLWLWRQRLHGRRLPLTHAAN